MTVSPAAQIARATATSTRSADPVTASILPRATGPPKSVGKPAPVSQCTGRIEPSQPSLAPAASTNAVTIGLARCPVAVPLDAPSLPQSPSRAHTVSREPSGYRTCTTYASVGFWHTIGVYVRG